MMPLLILGCQFQLNQILDNQNLFYKIYSSSVGETKNVSVIVTFVLRYSISDYLLYEFQLLGSF